MNVKISRRDLRVSHRTVAQTLTKMKQILGCVMEIILKQAYTNA